jgi:hypothetical protein
MKRMQRFGSFGTVLLLLAFGTVIPRLATARGFCNINGLGPEVLQQEVKSAGAVFFEGGSHLMAMLAAFERGGSGDIDKAKAVGSSAQESFGSASMLYKSVSGKVSQIDNGKLATVNVETVAAMAGTSPSTPLFVATAKIARDANASTHLMGLCGNESELMRAATAEFLKTTPDTEKQYVAILTVWSRVLFVGRTVSAFFCSCWGSKVRQLSS